MSRSLSRLEAPRRNHRGVEPIVADRLVDQHEVARSPPSCVRMPPAGLTPTWRPVASRKSRTASQHDQRDRQRRGRLHLAGAGLDEVAAGEHREPAMPAARCRRSRARRSRGSPSGAAVAAGRLHLHDLVEHVEVVARRNAPRSITMSISSAPVATASRTSASLTSSEARPDGKAVATLATLTPLSPSYSLAVGTRSG